VDEGLQFQILLWSLALIASASLGLPAAWKSRRMWLHPGVIIFGLFFLAYGLPSLRIGLYGPIEIGIWQLPFLPSALAFVSLFLLCFWASFYWGQSLLGSFWPEPRPEAKFGITGFTLPPSLAIVALSVLAFLIYLITNHYAGGTFFQTGSIWQAGLFNSRIAFYTQLGVLLTAALFFPATFLAGCCWGKNKKNILLFSPLIHSLYIAASSLSRGVLLPPFFFMAAAYLSTCRPKEIGRLLLVIMPLSVIGLVMFYHARRAGWGGISEPLTDWFLFKELFLTSTGIDALSSLNHAFYFRDCGIGGMGWFHWLFSMVPLPSFLGIGWNQDYVYSVSFASILNRSIGASGWPCPAWGEFYIQMGWSGVLVGIILGPSLARLWNYLDSKDNSIFSTLAILLYICVIQGFIISFHSPSRAATRMAVYALFFWGLFKLMGFIRPLYKCGHGKISRPIRERNICKSNHL